MKPAALGFFLLACSFLTSAQEDYEQYLLDLYEAEEFAQVLLSADSILQANENVNLARVNHIKADAYYFLNDVEASLSYYLLAIEQSSHFMLTKTQTVACYSHAGFCYRYLGKYPEAIPYYEIALSLSIEIKDSVEIANQTSSLGNIYRELGNYQKAQGFYNTAYQIDLALQDTAGLAYDLTNLGDLKLTLGDTEIAIQYFKDAVKVKKTIGDDHTIHVLRLGKLSQAYLAAGKLDSAETYSRAAIAESIEIGDSLSLNKQFITEAGILNAKKEFSSALESAGKAFLYFNDGDNSYQVTSAFEIATAYVGKRQFQEAKNLLTTTLSIAKKNNLLEKTGSIYERRAQVNEMLRNQHAALTDYKSFQSIKDTLQQLDKQKAILTLDQEYQTSQKQQQIELLEAKEQLSQLELDRRRRENIILSILLVVFFSAAIYIYISLRKKNQLQKSLLTSQLNELRLQIKAIIEGSPEDIKLEMDALNSSIQEPLSEREFEILNFAITDLSNTEIAEKTFVSVNTVKYHLKNVYAKLGVSNRREALKFAFQNTSK